MFSLPGSRGRKQLGRRALRFETLEDRSVPAGLGVGVNFSWSGSLAIPAVGNSGAVGPDNYVQMHAGDFVVFDKDGNLISGSEKTDAQFWNDAGVPGTSTIQGLSEPRVAYDPLSERWFASEITLASTNNEVLIGRSDTSDPAGTWKAVRYIGIGSFFASFPTLGLDANGVYIGTGDFTSSSGVPLGSTMTSIPKADLLLSTPTLANKTTVNQLSPPFGSGVTMGWSPQGVTNFDPSDTTASVIATHYTDFDKIIYTEISGTGAAALRSAAPPVAPSRTTPCRARCGSRTALGRSPAATTTDTPRRSCKSAI